MSYILRKSDRRSGKTTKAILNAIAAAYNSPDSVVYVNDPDIHEYEMAKALREKTEETINKLGLKGFKVQAKLLAVTVIYDGLPTSLYVDHDGNFYEAKRV